MVRLGVMLGIIVGSNFGFVQAMETWIKNPRFAASAAHYTLEGAAIWGRCGTEKEMTDHGIALPSHKSVAGVTQRVTGFPMGQGKWYRFSVRGLAESKFQGEDIALRVGFFGQQGKNPLDGVTLKLMPLIERDRKMLTINGNHGKNGAAVWKTYSLDFRLPFSEIDTLDLSVGFTKGQAKESPWSEFYVTDFELRAIPSQEAEPKVVTNAKTPAMESLMPLGGRWYYADEAGKMERPTKLLVNAKNAERLFYFDGKLSNPFAPNMTGWLRPGYLDLKGDMVKEDRFVPDNIVLEFVDGKELIVYAKNIPNHPTALYPWFAPGSIQELNQRYRLPLEPKRNPKAVAMDATNSNRALPMGPIGVAINGVAFFNPYDAGMSEAVNIMDRCCGHPTPQNFYHYHKYPVCVKTPFADDGEAHSPILGFARDGFPIYGPYVAKGLMAKDDTTNPLDAFNMRNDPERGWHYHVTPGKFPYIIGGFAGEAGRR